MKLETNHLTEQTSYMKKAWKEIETNLQLYNKFIEDQIDKVTCLQESSNYTVYTDGGFKIKSSKSISAMCAFGRTELISQKQIISRGNNSFMSKINTVLLAIQWLDEKQISSKVAIILDNLSVLQTILKPNVKTGNAVNYRISRHMRKWFNQSKLTIE
ncbi:hypothetical protein AMATHDRAFT_10067 [Amanita thiersii Skay4041]|uniref:Uncharacterized protein n=1 Tax=Amanita thiersii Skay4041 TaxID=703135 RepID=A0A2A9NBJ3_9AGAR|nr:hypothetical protein AMATHDRAFT_10067 [Amanita thiersii Skay4041]